MNLFNRGQCKTYHNPVNLSLNVLIVFIFLSLIALKTFAQVQLPFARISEFKNGQVWDSSDYSRYYYNSMDLLIQTNSKKWHAFTQSWLDVMEYHYLYNSNNDRVYEIRLKYDLFQEKWDTTTRITWKYNNKDLLQSVQYEVLENGWNTFSLDSSFYDSSGKLVKKITYWNDGNDLVPLELKEYVYKANLLDSYYRLWRDTINNKWDSISKDQYVYNIPLKVDTLISYLYVNGTGWENNTMDHIKYNGSNNVELEERYTWNKNLSKYERSSKKTVSFYPDQSINIVLYETWNTNQEVYEDYSRTTYKYPIYNSTFDVENNVDIELFPNPASNYILINWNGPLTVTYEIFTIEGKKITSGMINSQIERINVGNWKKGTYLFRLNWDKSVHQIIIE